MNGRLISFVALRMLALALIGSSAFAVALTGVLALGEFGALTLDAFLLFYGAVAPIVSLQGPFIRLTDRTEATQAALGALIAGFILILLPLSLAVRHEDRQLFDQFDWFAGVAIYLVVTAVCVIDLVWRRRGIAA